MLERTVTLSLALPASLSPLRSLLRGALPHPLMASGDNGDGFPGYVERAAADGIDVNDWIERELHWTPALPVLAELVFPLITPASVVCEVGVGTGRWSRHLLTRVPEGRLVLVDRSQWVVGFVRDYFRTSQNVRAIACQGGASLPFDDSSWADLFFSQGLFITMKLGHIRCYLNEFARALKKGGHAVFDFIDPSTPMGWEFLERESVRAHDVFTYHSAAHIEGCCNAAGLHVEKFESIGKSTYVVARKI